MSMPPQALFLIHIDIEPNDEEDELWHHTNDIEANSRVVHIVEQPCLVGIHNDPTVMDYSCKRPIVYRYFLSVDTGKLMDTGANCCITNNLACFWSSSTIYLPSLWVSLTAVPTKKGGVSSISTKQAKLLVMQQLAPLPINSPVSTMIR